jgi:hypothetical protein
MFAIEILFYNLMIISGFKFGSGLLKVDSEQRVSTNSTTSDVLLRKRA